MGMKQGYSDGENIESEANPLAQKLKGCGKRQERASAARKARPVFPLLSQTDRVFKISALLPREERERVGQIGQRSKIEKRSNKHWSWE